MFQRVIQSINFLFALQSQRSKHRKEQHFQVRMMKSIPRMHLSLPFVPSGHVSVCFRCPVMLVVGDQAPYEEAAVSLYANKHHSSTDTHETHCTSVSVH